MESRIDVICKECNKPFSISEEEQAWIKERGLALYKRCADCRKKRKTGRQDAQARVKEYKDAKA